jgi:PBSX family phage terminase large subunit
MKKRKINTTTAFKFQPFSVKQKKLLSWWTSKSPYNDYDMVIADGAVRSGKTVAEIDSFMMWSLSTFEDESFILAARSMGALKRNVLLPMFKILTAKEIPYIYHRSAEDPHVQVGTNRYYLFGANNEKSQDTLAGLTAAGAYADEIALFPKSFVDQMIARCSIDGAKVFANCNPQGPYHWFKLDYIDKAEEKRILYLHFTMDDNLSLSQRVKERYRRMFSGVFFRRYILGLWVMAEGVIFDMFTDKHKVETVDRAYTDYYVSCDYGTQNPMTYGLWGKFQGKWYKVKEYHYSGRDTGKQKDNEEYYKDLDRFIGDIQVNGVIVDPSAASFIATIRKHGKFRIVKAKNDVITGIQNMATALSQNMIAYNDCCTETFREFFSYIWDPRAADRGEDAPLKLNDHHMDGDRYFINTILFRKSISVLT